MLDPATLSDYWLAALPPEEEERVEEHLLGCDSCARELERLAALGDAIRKIVRQGRVRLVISREFLERLESEGLRVRAYSPPAGGGVQCTVTAGDDLLVARLSAELAERGGSTSCNATLRAPSCAGSRTCRSTPGAARSL